MTSQLPAAGRFRPASTADFSQYAKNLAWLLQGPLQEAQETLSQAYGFEGMHELQVALGQRQEAGPFQPAVRWPLFCATPGVTHSLSKDKAPGQDFDWLFSSPGEARLVALLRKNSHEGLLNRRRLGVLEAGFFCDPKTHRRLFRRVKEGCLALESSVESQLGWLRRNWPIGFWPLLRELYGPQALWELSQASDGKLSRYSLALKLCRYRAPFIYAELTRDVPASNGESDFYGQPPDSEEVALSAGATGLFALEEGWIYQVEDLCEKHQVVRGADHLAMLYDRMGQRVAGLAIELPDELRAIPGLEQLLDGYRYSALREQVYAFVNAPPYQQIAGMGHRSAWPHQFSGRDERGLSLAELAVRRVAEMSQMLDVRLELRRHSFGETEGCGMSLWRYFAYFTHVRGSDLVVTSVGHMSGWFIVPWDEHGRLVHEDDLFECMDAASAQLNDVWKVLVGEYLPSQELDSYVELYQLSGELECMATAEIELESTFRGKGLVPSLFDAVGSCLSNGGFSFLDAGWEAYAKLSAGRELHSCEIGDRMAEASGLPLFNSPIVWFLPVAGAPPADTFMYPHLRGSLRKTEPRNPRAPAEKLKRKLIKHFKAMQDEVDGDIVCYDPYDYPAT